MKKKITKSALVLAICGLAALNASSQIINTVAGVSTGGYTGDGGPATAAEINAPWDAVIDGFNNQYIADYNNNVIRLVNTSGNISTVAGNHIAGYSGDGGQATAAELRNPGGLVLDASRNLFISDNGNNIIRIVNTSGIISTFAGNATPGFSGDGGAATAAQLNLNGTGHPTTDPTTGNLYIPDALNNRIRIVNTSGIITTIAGNGTSGYSGNGGPATAAELNIPDALAFDPSGNLYIADAGNSVIRMINTSGIISTVAGGVAGFSGDGGQATAAEINSPYGVSVDGTGNLYIADGLNKRIRMVTTSGIITTIAGTGTTGFSGDGGPATAAEISSPFSVFSDVAGNSYISDAANNRVREVTSVPNSIKAVISTDNKILVYPNPFNNNVNLNINEPATVSLVNMMGQTVGTWIMEKGMHTINTDGIAIGAYMLQIKSQNGVINKKLIKM